MIFIKISFKNRVTISMFRYQCKINKTKNSIKMKKVFSIVAVALVATSFVACGPSAEEKAKMEENAKRIADSMAAAVEASMQTAAPEVVDTTAKAAETATTAAPAEEVKK